MAAAPTAPGEVLRHHLSAGQVNTIMAAAAAHSLAGQKLTPGPMKAVRNADGSVSVCAYVYTGGTSILGGRNHYFLTGRFPIATSPAGEIQRSASDAGSLWLMADCRARGMGLE
ncbi:MAG: hypothetical protein KDJ37_04380 [Hyphomicrobiaceae bacterium]|nr:hypothetical protein [Hyphomicrobiaceae bacterium]